MNEVKKKKLLIVVNVDWFFVSHRLPIAVEAGRQGYEVHLAMQFTEHLDYLQRKGFVVHPIKIERSNTSFVNAINIIFQLSSLFRRVQPDVVHLVTIKPVLLGGIAARLTAVKSVVSAVSGMGFVFLDSGIKAALRRKVVTALYRVVLGHRNSRVILQNAEDRDWMIRLIGLVKEKTEIIRGSGVELSRYNYKPLPEGIPVILMAARLLKDKGIYEFVDAARMLKKRGGHARFCLAGSVDAENPSCISDFQLNSWVAEGVIEYWGHRKDMNEVLSSAYLVVLPSYREGLPKILIEAAACGRAVITTDVPGCRDAIEPNITGVLVPARDAGTLVCAIQSLIADRQKCFEMGRAGRALAVKAFDIKLVVARHLQIYQDLQSEKV